MDFPFYNQHFAHELDFSWNYHQQRLLGFGHDPNAIEHQPERIPGGYETMGGMVKLPCSCRSQCLLCLLTPKMSLWT